MKVRILGSPHGLVLRRRLVRRAADRICLASALDPSRWLAFDLAGRALAGDVTLPFVARIHPDDVAALNEATVPAAPDRAG